MTGTFIAAADGLSIWEGPAADPFKIAFVPWSAIVEVQASRARIGALSSRSLHITLHDSRVMSLQPLGSGLLNMFAIAPADLAQLVQMLEEIRVHEVTQGHRSADLA